MSETGVIALDPYRLARLDGYLFGLAEGCARRAGQIADQLAAVGEPDPGLAEGLRSVGRWCGLARDDVARRRAMIAALPESLPLTALALHDAEAEILGRRLGEDLREVLRSEPPSWDEVSRILTEVERIAHSPVFAAHFLRGLTGEVAFSLPVAVEEALVAATPTDGEPSPDELARAVELQEVLARVLQSASTLPPDHGGLSDDWLRDYFGLPSSAEPLPVGEDGEALGDVSVVLAGSGAGLRSAATVATGLAWLGDRAQGFAMRAVAMGRVAPVLSVTGSVVGLAAAVTNVAGRAATDPVCAVAELAVTSLAAGATVAGAVLAPGGPMGYVLAAGGFLLWQGAMRLRTCRDGERARPRPDVVDSNDRVYDPATGTSRYPGGGTDTPWQDGAGGVLPPNMTRGGP